MPFNEALPVCAENGSLYATRPHMPVSEVLKSSGCLSNLSC